MTTNITTLALNLLISERIEYRNIFADRILESLHQGNSDLENEKVLRNNFIEVLTKCIDNPNCEERNAFFQLAQYYTEKMNKTADLSAVA